MVDLTTITSPVYGEAGEAFELPIRPGHDAAQSVCHWLVNAPGAHPLWSQWVIACVRPDDDVPGFPPPHRQFEGATHEVLIVAVNPDHPITPELAAQSDYELVYLEPVNLASQVTATDDEMRLVVAGMAWACAHGVMTPEPWLGYGSFREAWLTTIVKTLGHIRGEEHAP